MAARAVLGEDDLAAVELVLIRGQIGLAARRVLQVVGPRARQEEQGDVGGLRDVGVPVRRVLLQHGDLDRGDPLAGKVPDQRPEMEEPLLAEQADVDVDAVQRAENPDRIGAILEHMSGQHGVRRNEVLRERLGAGVLVELLVQGLPASQLLRVELGHSQARRDAVDRVHRARVVDVVARDERRVEGARQRGVKQLVDEVLVPPLRIPEEDSVDPEILRARVGGQVLPLRILGVLGRIDRTRADVAEAARHPDTVWPHEVLVVVVLGVGVVPDRIPFLLGRLVERRIREETQAHDTAGVAVVGADGYGLAAGSDLHPGILALVLEGVGWADAPVQPQAKSLGIAALAVGLLVGLLVSLPVAALGIPRLEARLVHQSEILPPVGPGRPRRTGGPRP